MPSPFTSTFASAAAGNNASDGSSGARNFGGGDWPRTRPNGATQTFRRPSATSGLSTQREPNQATANSTSSTASVYVPPHIASSYQSSSIRNGASAETRYSKEQLFEIFKLQEKAGQPAANVDDLFVDGWNPSAINGTENGGWGKKDDHREAIGSDICWDHKGSVQPIGLVPLTDEEKEIFSSTVNSALKPAPTTNKDGNPREGLNRRSSTTQSQNLISSPTARPGGRRRESTDMLQSRDPLSPSSNRFSKEEGTISSPPPSLMRRITDVKEGLSGANVEQKDSEGNPRSNDLSSPFGSLKRTQTGPVSAGLNGHSSPWVNAPQSAGFAPMGAFGSFGVMDSASSEKRPGFGSVRGESRFKGLMTSGSSENINSIIQEKSSNSNLGKLSEADNEQSLKWEGAHRESGHDADHDEDDMDEMDRPAGSAALGGVDASPTGPPSSRFRSSDRQISYDEIGFSSLGMSSDMPFREMMQRREFSHQQTPQRSHATMQPNEPMSPTDTNPYQSPEGERAMPNAMDHDEPDFPHSHFHGQGGFGQPGRNFQSQLESHDRSQTSSTGPPKPFSGLGGLGNLGSLGGSNPWSAAPGAIGTPSRAQPSQTPGFGDSAFGNYGDIGTPAQGAVGGGGFFGAAAANSNNSGAVGRGSKLGSLFPSSTQDLGLGEGQRQEQLFREGNELFSRNSQGYSGTPRDLEGLPSRANQMDDLPGGDKRLSGPQGFGSLADRDAGQAPGSGLLQTAFSGAPSNSTFFARSQDSDHPAPPNQLPTSQQRQMVMPDRMRWIYRDPQGATQGPWSGLEMHDWYKAGFFSPELQVKKLEDTEYEPLAQLIRRIGNSREPFLVPQIGIPHGAPTSASIGGPSSATAPASTAQPPFASSFPSFGTTLTAEQQNALERRKQEEQYLMARQKEHLAQQQVYLKQMQHMQGGLHNQQLHHQSSGHSLHSQPSFGSITSPTGYQPPPAQGPIQPPPQMPAFFDTSLRNAGPLSAEVLGSVREEDMPGLVERLNIGRGNQMQFSGPQGMDHQQRVNLMMQERNRLSREQEQFDMLQRSDDDPRLTAERLEQYKQLRSQEDDNQHPQPGPIGGQTNRLSASARDFEEPQEEAPSDNRLPEPLSLSEQVQKAAAKQPSTTQPQSPWAKVDAGMPQSLPPPQSSSPMPAPTPQRNRQSVAEALNAESQSPQTESVETPSATVAPWAKDNSETMKGPSLKEIQEVEAQKAAQREEMQAAARRAVAEQERLSQQNQTGTAPAPGLPSSANWASGVPPAVPATPGVSAWTKPNGGKPTVATPVPAAKKTLAQIQKEEEARKSRAAAAAAAAVASAAGGNANMTATAGGKRYADLAGRGGQSTAPNPNNVAWTTVGAGGKAKAPPAPTPSMATRTSSGGVAPPSAVSTKPKPAAMPSTKSSQQNASDELQKWTKNALNKGLDSKIPLDGFVASLLDLPPEPDIISDSIYANSQTLDGRRFAEEFLRRRKLADRGVIPDSSSPGISSFSSANNGAESKSGSGGWSEVAKKGGQATSGSGGGSGVKDDGLNSQFKVVSGKKKAGKR